MMFTYQSPAFAADPKAGDACTDGQIEIDALVLDDNTKNLFCNPRILKLEKVTDIGKDELDQKYLVKTENFAGDGHNQILVLGFPGSITIKDPIDSSQTVMLIVQSTDGKEIVFENGQKVDVVYDADNPELPAGPTSPAVIGAPGTAVDAVAKGADGSRGRDGGGVWVFSVSAKEGKAGKNGATVNRTVSSSHGSIRTTAPNQSAVEVGSIGGNGGRGGNFYGIANEAKPGGIGGSGGDVTVNNAVQLSTEGEEAHGILAYSHGGTGGTGGTGYGVGVGGGGGGMTNTTGGTVTVDNSGDITTGGANAKGIYAYSIGGSGGAGGSSWGLVGVGGTGAKGGIGGAVNVVNSGEIITQGSGAHGILAESIGGSGGSGGDAGGLAGFGGSAEAGGHAGVVTVTHSGSITTNGSAAIGLLAQSVGGGGGDGGSAGGIVAIGGKGGGAGNGKAVTVKLKNDGSITTEEDSSLGVLVQSIGGGGGNGGNAYAGGLFASVGIGADAGGGGHGGAVNLNLDNIALGRQAHNITTKGHNSAGLVAQSIGGGGGNGGGAVSVAVGVSVSAAVGIGGKGGTGGNGNTVTLNGDGSITTHGSNSTGVLAQSVGGGGGNGGTAIAASVQGFTAGVAIGVSLGGEGASGGAGDNVTTDFGGRIDTRGENSAGFVAQSIGGGGGNGGASISAVASGGVVSAGIGVSLGGSGGPGSSGGTVNATIGSRGAAIINTEGANSSGVVVQSVGGGGGNGGTSIAGVLSGGQFSGAVAVVLGGDGGSGANSSNVSADINANVTTKGARSDAIVVQSVGGGGGNGGLTIAGAGSGGQYSGGIGVALGGKGGVGANAGNVTDTVVGKDQIVTVKTEGSKSTGVLIQSVGGGGGNAGTTIAAAGSGGKYSGGIAVGVGASGGNGAQAGEVSAEVNANTHTKGANSDAILIQSIGGGGGNGATTIAGAASGGQYSGGISVGVGGSGGVGGEGNTVEAHVGKLGRVAISTKGAQSNGVTVQSIGGGGGSAKVSIVGAASGGEYSGALSIGIGGSGGSGGISKGVVATVNADITTGQTPDDLQTVPIAPSAGHGSIGVLVQSIGGGGGNGGLVVSGAASVGQTGLSGTFALGGSGGTGGNAGTSTSTQSGSVATYGREASGVVTQSIGGGGGNGGMSISASVTLATKTSGAIGVGIGGSGGAAGNGTTVESTVNGTIFTKGNDADGVLAQSVGGGGGNGSLNVSGMIGVSADKSGGINVGIGGKGGAAGNASEVTLTLNKDNDPDLGFITTQGNSSTGAIAQSIGGGGGNGGTNISGELNLASSKGGNINVGIGGFGGNGGNAGVVTLINTKTITTFGEGSSGLIAQSVGGGGGNGGTNISGSAVLANNGKNGTVTFGLGGFGGGAGTAKKVTLDHTGIVIAGARSETTDTEGAVEIGAKYYRAMPDPVDGSGAVIRQIEGSHGILAQSIGGGGGNGGTNISGALTLELNGISGGVQQSNSLAVVVGSGGAGGAGNDAGEVDLEVRSGSTIVAFGDGGSGVTAQSIGGGGGNGGLNVSGGITGSAPIVVGVGGMGGSAGKAAAVNADVLETTIYTDGLKSHGLSAQSIGGGGGSGGLNVSGSIAVAKKDSGIPAITIGIGGFGGDGNTSGAVTVNQSGAITTAGAESHAIYAQSIAGGGGDGALNVSAGISNSADQPAVGNSGGSTDLGIVFGLGGFGGEGAEAADVSVTSQGVLTTLERGSKGIFAQSIGGGGGNGGMNISGQVATDGSLLTAGVGGFADSGANSGKVAVIFGDTDAQTIDKILTKGADSHGIEASSIGGGGGDAGANIAVSFIKKSDPVEPDDDGTDSSRPHPQNSNVDDAVFAKFDKVLEELEQQQGGKTKPTETPSASQNNDSYAVQAMIGGSGGGAGDGNEVDVTNNSTIITEGDSSYGILAQSIGGGGGNASYNLTFNMIKGDKNSKGANLGLGGAGKVGGTGGDVMVRHNGNIITSGTNSVGILAQSIGGGGGNAGFNKKLTGSGDAASHLNLMIGRKGAGGGTGGNVTVNLSAEAVIVTGYKNTPSNLVPDAVLAASAAEIMGAHGVLAQSIGGGGGNGSASTFSINSGEERSESSNGFAIGLGLSGGEGAIGGTVKVDSGAIIFTNALFSHGIIAQSIGGGGGNAGAVKTASAGSNSVSIAIGAAGGSGALGGQVDVTNTGHIFTAGAQSVGVLAQSIGGGGGNASKVDAVANDKEKTDADNKFSVSIGGEGGTGNNGGNVMVTNGVVGELTNQSESDLNNPAKLNPTIIITEGGSSHGIMAMSIGGGGGNAGTVSTTASANKDDKAPQAKGLQLRIGNAGGVGGNGGSVSVYNNGVIWTKGAQAHGIIAQSIGGGGGNGSDTSKTKVNPSLTKLKNNAKEELFKDDPMVDIGIGGKGGLGADGGLVIVSNYGVIHVDGDGSHGIIAQSIGGGGGTGGSAKSGVSPRSVATSENKVKAILSNIAVGGFGGEGGNGGDVKVNHSGTIVSNGDNSYGILAQSIAGGGGNASSAQRSIIGSVVDASLNAVLGGRGGATGETGEVSVSTTGDITMNGANSQAVVYQSISGGGGNVDTFTDISGTVLPAPNGDGNTGGGYFLASYLANPIQLGADLAEYTGAKDLTTEHIGNLETKGQNAIGSLSQSIAGGGGKLVQTIKVVDRKLVTLTGQLGALANNLPAGGEVQGATGAKIEEFLTGNVQTEGDGAGGVVSQSIGGGGGILAFNVIEELVVPTNFAQAGSLQVGAFSTQSVPQSQIMTATAPTPLPPSTLQMGSDGGTGNHGSDVTRIQTGGGTTPDGIEIAVVSTKGNLAPGTLLQSIGAGGGQTTSLGLSDLTVEMGAKGGANGDGKAVDYTVTGSTLTDGNRSHGIVLQSIGGGGGLVLTDLDISDVSITKNTDNSGTGAAVKLISNGDVIVLGTESIGVLAQSIGGGGGAVDMAFFGTAGGSGNSGNIDLSLEGSVLARNDNSIAVLAQAQSTGTEGNITVNLNGKNTIGGKGGIGVQLSGGSTNTLNNKSNLMTVDGIEGLAIKGGTGIDEIYNAGHIMGDIDLGTGMNKLVNRNTALSLLSLSGPDAGTKRASVYSGDIIDLGNPLSEFLNYDDLVIAGIDLQKTTMLNGSFKQLETGRTYSELNFQGPVNDNSENDDILDRLNATGAVELDGEFLVNLLNKQVIKPGNFVKVAFQGDASVTDNGIDLVTQKSVVINFDSGKINDNQYALHYAVDFAVKGTNTNEMEVGEYINRVQMVGSTKALAPTIISQVDTAEISDYRVEMTDLSGELYSRNQAVALRNSDYFTQSLMICGGSGGDVFRVIKDGSCGWFYGGGEWSRTGGNFEYKGTGTNTMRYAGGAQKAIDANWNISLAGSLAQDWSKGYGGAWKSRSVTGQVGIAAKYSFDATKLSAGLSYSFSHSESQRAGVMLFDGTAETGRSTDVVGGILRLSHDFVSSGVYARPYMDLGLAYMTGYSAEEHGAGALNLQIRRNSEGHAWMRPGFELGYEGIIPGQGTLNLFANISLQQRLSGTATAAYSTLEGGPGGVDPMKALANLGETAFEVKTGLELKLDDFGTVGLHFEHRTAGNLHDNAARLNLSIPF